MVEREARFGSKPSQLQSGKRGVKAQNVIYNDRRGSSAAGSLKILKSKQTPLSSNVKNPRDRYDSGGHEKINAGNRYSCRQPESATNEHENQTTPARKPLSPVSLLLSSNMNISFTNDPTKTFQKTLPFNITPTSPVHSMISSSVDEENMKTPKKTIPMLPLTPPTSLSMKMAMTPSTPFALDDVEYSFEEIRAGHFP